jgi:F-type H+-transporting ATPase subunit a
VRTLAGLGLDVGVAPANPLEHVVQHPIVTREMDLGPLTPEGVVTLFSDQIAMIVLSGVLLSVLLPIVVRRRRGSDEIARLVPSGSANMVEAICEYLRKEVAEPSLGPHTDRFIKFVWTVFFFVMTMNVLGMLPLAAVTPLFGAHIGGTATANIWTTGALAVSSLGMWLVNGVRLGGKAFFAHLNPGPWWLAPLMVPLEIFGFFAKTFALAVRLFANMMAGHTVLAVLLSFILGLGTAAGALAGLGVAVPVVAFSVALSLLELFVAVLQAFIFTFLTVLFLGMYTVADHGGEHAEAHSR